MNHESRMLIDGKLVDSETGARFDNINPATEAVLGSTADGTRADMERAIAAARHAFDHTDWSRNGALRADGLRQLQAALEAEQEDIRSELVAEVGCPPVLSTFGPQLDVPLKEALSWPADMIGEFAWKRALPDKDAFGMGVLAAREVWKEPVGVVGVVTPWNFPFEIILNKIGPILAMGNTMVLKPAPPDTPPGTRRASDGSSPSRPIYRRGVINIVASSDHLVGEVLSTSPPLVDMVAFTGSTATGRRIMKAAADTVKPTFLELGGKSVYLVLDEDGDIAASVGGSAFISMHAGQGCAMPTRLLVPNSRYDEAVEIVKVAMEKNKYGDPTDPSVLQGPPQVSKRQQERVLGYIAKGKAEGARLVTGGGIPPRDQPRGFFVEPTIFADVDNRMTIAQEEIFGPVLSVIGFDGDDDAVRIANDSIYGLSGVVFAHDLERAKSVASRIRTGTLGINGGLWYGADAPFGGYKQSGIGRQCGIEGLEIFTQTKTVGWPAQ